MKSVDRVLVLKHSGNTKGSYMIRSDDLNVWLGNGVDTIVVMTAVGRYSADIEDWIDSSDIEVDDEWYKSMPFSRMVKG